MTPAGALLAAEIQRTGPIPFRRFMEVALYHPEHGYYRRGHDVFGKHGDYYTAVQIQPVYGILIASLVEMLAEESGLGDRFEVVDLGAGRGEMAPFLSRWRYRPVEAGDSMPGEICGLVFANEFFDALPVDVARRRGVRFHEIRVGLGAGGFVWVEGGRVAPEQEHYLRRHASAAEDGSRVEVALEALRWVERIAQSLTRGWLLVIDYGYTARELVRFPTGTLMSYRRHRAYEDVLTEPGERDITAHVPFSALEEQARRAGLEPVRLESLASLLLRIGERDRFARALEASTEREAIRRRLQLKSLLFDMGESFRALLMRRGG
jgi:SAM-dependent MidA family methyltransferase